MKVAVLRAGVIGAATAYELWRDGHEVVVVDRAAAPAAGTSFANAGMIAPGHAYAWSSPPALRTLLRALTRDDLALRFWFRADPQFWRWCWRFYRQRASERAAANTGHGHMGWTRACGSARITADLLAGRPPEHDVTSLPVQAVEIEATLGKPVTSSNHAMAWHVLRLAGIGDPLPRWGRLFAG